MSVGKKRERERERTEKSFSTGVLEITERIFNDARSIPMIKIV